jgi:hypothetical protein
MAVVLLVLGIAVAACGVAAMGYGFGIPVNEYGLGAALISGGSTALVGGFVLIGLSAVVSEIGRLGNALKSPVQPAQRSSEAFDPAIAGVSPSPVAAPAPRVAPPTLPVPPRLRPEAPAREMRPPAAHPASPSSVEVSAAAIERLRSTIPRAEGPRLEPQVPAPATSAPQSSDQGEEAPLSPNGPPGGGHQPTAKARAEPATPDPKPAPGERPGEAAEALKASRLDFLFRSKPARPPPPEDFEAVWPAEDRPAKNAALTPQSAEPRPGPSPPMQEPARTQPSTPEASAPTILKSGVVDGMAYTLYTDGSIEAKLPQGTIKFGSVSELRAHIESNS